MTGVAETVEIVVVHPLETTEYDYDLFGNLDLVEMPNRVLSDYTYDEMDRLDIITHYGPDSTPGTLLDNPILSKYDYGIYRADGKKTGVTETTYTTVGGVPVPQTTTYTWGYDNLGRLTSENLDHHEDALDQVAGWKYDLAGNRVEQTIDRPATETGFA